VRGTGWVGLGRGGRGLGLSRVGGLGRVGGEAGLGGSVKVGALLCLFSCSEVARTVVAPPSSVVECLWEVFVGVWGVVLVVCVCVGVGGVVLCRCVCSVPGVLLSVVCECVSC